MEHFLNKYKCHVKCVDDTNPISPLQRPRGMSGTAICYKREISSSVTEKSDGSMRINVIKVDVKPKPLLIIGVYMPCRGGIDADRDYREITDELSEIILKYKSSCDIVIAGDTNASTARDKPNSRDKLFLDFIKEHNFYTPNGLGQENTYFHPSGMSSTQIDYILESTPGLVTNFKVLQRHPLNTSQHDPVAGCINVDLDTYNSEPIISNLPPRVKWEKINKEKYQNMVSNKLLEINLEPEKSTYSELSNVTSELCAILDTAARACAPTQKSKSRPKSSRSWSPAINKACKVSKQKFWEWKCDGRPLNLNCMSLINMKEAKKRLRSTQRQHEAMLRKSKYEKIMKAHEGDQQTFYRLIANQRKDGSVQTTCLKVEENLLSTPNDIRNGWADYFEELATPHYNKNSYQNQVELDCLFLEDIFRSEQKSQIIVSEELVSEVICQLKNGKAADSAGICSEHLKYGGKTLVVMLTKLINLIFQSCTLPELFEMGLVSPVFKNKGKPATDPNSYRKITVTSVINKVMEKLHLNDNSTIINKIQNYLQRGFTAGISPIFAAIIITELFAEAKDNKLLLILALLDAQKAFDKLWHSSLLRKSYQIGIEGDKWLMLKAWYNELVSQVKWSGGLSRPFPEKQGVRQGGVWSPTAYKIFINPLLDLLQKNGLGCYIGSIYCGTPTVADDICLASNCPYELQAMLDLQENYALQENYTLSETKSTVLVTGNQDTHEFLLNGSLIQQSETATHLGITRDSKSRFDSSTVVQERISTARRATYAMMGAGLHGINGLNPCVSLHLIRIYIIPRLTYGLEAIRLAAKDLTTINQYYKRLLKQIQHLPDKAADSACYLLLGEPPIKAEIHRRILTTFGNIIRNFDSIEHQLAWRQLATKSKSSNSWFIMVKSILEQYDLPSCYDLLQNPPGKLTWKELVKRTVNSYWDNKLKLEAASKSSLKYVDIDRLSIGKTHLIWSSAGQNTHAITKASIKCRMLLGVYTLQANRHKFNQYEVEPTCPLCKQGPEDRTHFLVQCQHLTSIRQPFIDALSKAIEEMSPGLYQQITSEPNQLTQIILDCSSSHLVLPQFYNRLECISRGLCYALHIARSTALDIHYK
ncbi:Hypothetical predicted protein [Mytilus galloprovincialis]|uniref:Reverse transcriptase domain-containing protein n=1 Tax=Mytilus galloprovincialis TaxID=29158 RepID=A0A8B6CIA8_MYTGA|nr:Hypothetical predicted protein [Mytilus galloprovincialis]